MLQTLTTLDDLQHFHGITLTLEFSSSKIYLGHSLKSNWAQN